MKNSYKLEEFQALWDNVIIKPIKLEKKGQFARPQLEEDKAELGEVIDVGFEVNIEAIIKIEKGDIVMFNKYSSTKIDLGDELIVRAEDVIAIKKK